MSTARKRTFTLAPEQEAFIETRLSSGDYASASDVVAAGLRALEEKEEATERWLREEVAAVYDAATADPSRSLPLESVFADIRARHAGKDRS